MHLKEEKIAQIHNRLDMILEGLEISSKKGSKLHEVERSFLNSLLRLGLEQEFTHVATPEENGYVEAYYGILKRELFNRFEYYTFAEAHRLINEFVDYYYHNRRHGSIRRMTPVQKWNQEKHLIAAKNRAA